MVALASKRNHCTLSYATRTTFRTNTPLGRAAFLVGWAALSLWFCPHILKDVNDA